MEGKVFTPEESTEILTHIAQNMVTKEDLHEAISASEARLTANLTTSITTGLRKEIRASEQRVMDYTDRRIGEAEGKITGMLGPFPKLKLQTI